MPTPRRQIESRQYLLRALLQEVLDGAVRLWEFESGKALHAIQAHDGHVRDIALSADETRFATAGEDTLIKLWDLENRACLGTYPGHESTPTSVVFLESGDVASSAWDATLRLWDDRNAREPLHSELPEQCLGVVSSPDDNQVLVDAQDEVVAFDASDVSRLWAVRRAPLGLFPGPHPQSAYLIDGTRVSIGKVDGHVELREATTGRLVGDLHACEGPVTRTYHLPNGRMLTGGADGSLACWDVEASGLVFRIAAQPDAVNCLALSPDGGVVATGGGQAATEISLRSVATGELVRRIEYGRGTIHALAFGPGGKHLFSGDRSGDLVCWNVATGRRVWSCRPHGQSVTSLVVTRDNLRLISSSPDKTVKFWELDSGREVFTLKRSDCKMYSLALSPDGLRLASGGTSGGLVIWDAQPRSR